MKKLEFLRKIGCFAIAFLMLVSTAAVYIPIVAVETAEEGESTEQTTTIQSATDPIEPVENFIVDISAREDANYKEAYDAYFFQMREDLGLFTTKICNLNLAHYSKVKITYGGASSAPVSGLPIALTKTEGELSKDQPYTDADNLLAYTPMIPITTSWAPDATVTIDLEGVDYAGDIYLSLPSLGGNAFQVYSIEFICKANTHTVTWKVEGQEDVIQTYVKGATPVYPNGTPTKAADAEYAYTFKGWTPAIVAVTGDVTYTAQFTQRVLADGYDYPLSGVLSLGADDSAEETNYFSVSLGELDLSRFAAVQITYSAAANEFSSMEFLGVPIGLASAEGRLGNLFEKHAGDVSAESVLAYARLSKAITAAGETATVIIDLTKVDYSGEVFLSTARQVGNRALLISDIQFVGKSYAEDYGVYHYDISAHPDAATLYKESSGYKLNYLALGMEDRDASGNYTDASYSISLGEIDLSLCSAVRVYYGHGADGQWTASGVNVPMAIASAEKNLGNLYVDKDGDVSGDHILAYSYLGTMPAANTTMGCVTIDLSQVDYNDGPVYLSTARPSGSPELRIAAIEFIYGAIYIPDEPTTYTVTWKVEGQEDVIQTYEEGETPAYPNATPEKAADAVYTYEFSGWTPSISAVAGDVTYTAQFTATPIVPGEPTEPTEPVENLVVDISAREDANYKAAYDAYFFQFGEGVAYTTKICNLNLANYTHVVITYGGSSSAPVSGLPIALTKTEGELNKNQPYTDANNLLAYTPMIPIKTSWSPSTTVTIDLAGVNYNGDVYLSLPSLGGNAFQVYSIEFIGRGNPVRDDSKIRVSGVFGDHMVVQRDQPIKIWGFADTVGETITGRFDGETATATVGADGTWMLTFKARPYTTVGQSMIILDEDGYGRVLKDILIGDVWFIGGQSNAELTVNPCLDYSTMDIKASDPIRLFTQRQYWISSNKDPYTLTPQKDIINPDWYWKTSTTEAVKGFSAMGYFFAKEVIKHTDVPQGMIMIAAGGATLRELMPESLAREHGYTEGATVGLGGYYNSLISPFVGYPCKGMLFFQGESESRANLAPKYADQMAALIADERERWGQNFPLYYVQLSDYLGGFNYCDMVRAQQFDALKTIPNSTMVVSMDIGAPVGYEDWAHSPYKQKLGVRLAKVVLAKEYGVGREDQVSSPAPVGAVLSSDKTKITVTFEKVAGGLTLLGKTPAESIGQQVAGFSVGKYAKRTLVTATITSANTVVIDVPAGADLTTVNYAYFNPVTTKEANLYADNGLPSVAFAISMTQATEPDDDVTTTDPADDVTTTDPADDVTTTDPADDVTTTEPVDDATTTEPADGPADGPAEGSTTAEPTTDPVGGTDDASGCGSSGCGSTLGVSVLSFLLMALAAAWIRKKQTDSCI